MEGVLLIVVIAAGLAIYFLPAIVGWNKKSSQGILLLNLFLGWTLLGWLGALIWAVSSDTEQESWIYTCPKCEFKSALNQKVKVYVCPQCKTEIEYQLDDEDYNSESSAWDWLTKKFKNNS